MQFIRRNRWLLLAFFISLSGLISGQQSMVDSLEELLANTSDPLERGRLLLSLSDAHKQIDLNRLEAYLRQAEQIAEFMEQPGMPLKVQYRYGILASRRDKGDSAAVILQEIIAQIPEEEPDSSLLSDCYYELANIERLRGNSTEAINYLHKATDIDLARNNRKGLVSIYVLLGILYKNQSLYDQAIDYYQRAYDYCVELGMTNSMASCVLNIANVYTRQEKYDEALEKYEQALEIGKSLDERDNIYAFVYGNMSNLYSIRKEIPKALDYARKSYELRKSIARPEEQANSLIGIANNLNHLGRSSEALSTLEEARKIVEGTSGILEAKERIYELEYKIHQNAGNPSQALDAVATYLIYHDSLRKTELEKQALELNTKYETAQKEQEIALLNAQNEATESKLHATRRQAYMLIGGLLLVSLLGFLIFRLFRKTQNQNQIIQKALDEKDILLREIHHRVKNNLQFISSLLGLQSEHISDLSALSALQEGQDRVQSMALIHQNLYQEDNLTGVEVHDYFVKLIRNLFDSYNIRPGQIELDLKIEALNLDVDSVIPIGLIVNELVSNALKYAFREKEQGSITVILEEEDQHLKLEVRDNGRGITGEELEHLGNSFGYRLINVFKDQLDANLHISNADGTRVVMSIHKYRKVA